MKSSPCAFVLRLLGNQLMMVVSAIIIRALLIVFFPNHEILSSMISFIILAVSMMGQYRIAWKWGERDRNLVKYNHITYQSKRGFFVGLISCAPTLAALIVLEIFAALYVYIVFIAVVALTPLFTGVGYLNGHKLKSYGISIVYRKKR